jgi:hypothetical protein
VTHTADIAVTVNSQLTLTLATDKENYNQGEIIRISGTALDVTGKLIPSGTATIKFSSGDWSWENTVRISGGAFADNFRISFGHPTGTWTILVNAADGLGNSGTASKNVSVAIPETHVYHVAILSPVGGLTYSRGEDIDISVNITEAGEGVENATVFLNTPTGEKITLTDVSGGFYTGRYRLKWGDPEGTWWVSVEGKKTVDSTFRAGGSYINVVIEPAMLQVALLSPTERRFEVGQSIKVSAEVSYPDGTLVEDVIVTVTTPAGENLVLMYEAPGIYSADYVVTERDTGPWTLKVSAVDLYGNAGEKSSVISIVPPSPVGVLARYWWAFLAILVGVGVVSAYVVQKARFVGRLERVRKEKREVIRLMKEAETKYYREGSITRDTFDELMRGYEKRAAELEREERVLKARVKKVRKRKPRKKKIARRKRGKIKRRKRRRAR